MWVLSVAIPRPLHQLFTYEIPPEWVDRVEIGGWVEVPFGRAHTHGFIVEKPRLLKEGESPGEFDLKRIKKIKALSDPELLLPTDVLELAKWAHDYYLAPLGEVIQSAYPTSALKKAPKRKAKTKPVVSVPIKSHPFKLSSAQENAIQVVEAHPHQPVLLHGVTGSGKTAVYVELAKKTLSLGQGVLFLVPEIALTPQLLDRLEESLGEPVALWHSAVAQGRRRMDWLLLKEGKIRVAVGARSAVFAPVKNLGLIVVDEEHDASFKQEDRVRYQARDLAIVRAQKNGSRVVLGSATPSLETLERVREGKFAYARLAERVVQGSAMPQVQVIDLCEVERISGIQSVLAEITLKEIQATIARGEQVIIFQNRRGFAAFLSCMECGEVPGCPRCSVSLTVHKRSRQLRCHLCDHREALPQQCKKCGGSTLAPVGSGTESLEAELPELIHGAKILRLDRDQVTSSARLEEILSTFRSGQANILLGTQMLVKGHDFPGVTLVVVVLADSLFRFPDFRASERAFQILTQVSGRAGRGHRPGKVFLQTFAPDHPVIQVLAGQETEAAFLENERTLRLELSYPPFSRLCRLKFEDRDPAQVRRHALKVAEWLREFSSREANENSLEILGPTESMIEKLKDVYRWELLIKSKNIQILHRALRRARSLAQLESLGFLIDLDPQGV